MPTMSIREILEYLPQRPPFLLIDRVLDIELEKSIVAIKSVTMNEPFFKGHFPGVPVMPGVLILEAMAQASGVLAYRSAKKQGKDYIFYFAGIDNARFKRIVEPGDQLRIEVHITKRKSYFWKVKATATVDGEVACSADLMSIGRDL